MPPAAARYRAELDVALALAREAGLRAVRARHGPLGLARKADRSLVTAVDRDLDTFLVGRLLERFPGDAAIGEESAGDTAEGDAPRRLWLVDPIDGTSNYAAGTGEFTVVLGLLEAGRPVLGVVFEPVGVRAFYAAGRGRAMSQCGEEPPVPVAVSRRASLEGARLVRSLSRRPSATEQYLARRGVPPPDRVGSLALRVSLVAAGLYDFTYSTDFRGGEWDLCGPLALVGAAGGTATDLEGRPIRLGRRPPARVTSLLVSNGRLHPGLIRAFAARPG